MDIITAERKTRNILYSDNENDLSALVVVLYSEHWDNVMNGYLYENVSNPGGRHAINNVHKGMDIVRHGLLMFMSPSALSKMSDVIAGSLSGEQVGRLTFLAEVSGNCNLRTTAIPESLYDAVKLEDGQLVDLSLQQRDFIEKIGALVAGTLSDFEAAFRNGDDFAYEMYYGAVERMIDTLKGLWRPWLAFYEQESKLKRMRQDIDIAAGPRAPPPPPPRPPKRRILHAVPELQGCAKTGAVIWFGIKGSGPGEVDLDRLSASMRSASLNYNVAKSFANGTGTVFGLLLDADVPVISVLDILGRRGKSFYCHSHECEIMIKHGCRYERLPGTSFVEQLEVIRNDFPMYHSALINSGTHLSFLKRVRPVFLTVRAP